MLRVTDYAQRTDTGRQRPHNEDSFVARVPLFAVADGMGGAQAGEDASRMAVEVLHEGLGEGTGTVAERLTDQVAEANRRIHELAQSDQRRAGMGTTLTAAYVDTGSLVVVHVGDSRLYRLRGDQLDRLTQDHSLVEELVRQGRLTPEEAAEHPQRSIITRALGPESEVAIDSEVLPVENGDLYMVCSDGLTAMLSEDHIHDLLLAGAGDSTLTARVDALVDAANEAGGRDNITVLLFRVGDDDAPPIARASGEEPTAAHPIVTDGATTTEQATAVMPIVPRPADGTAADDEPGARPAPASSATAAPASHGGRRRSAASGPGRSSSCSWSAASWSGPTSPPRPSTSSAATRAW